MAMEMEASKKEVKKSIVDHTYRDYSKVGISELIDNFRGLNEEIFPSKLHEILSTPEYARIIAWKSHGRAWEVVNRSSFISTVLPKYFNHRNFESFNRSVNMWGFKRLLREGPDQKSYYHELFLRCKPELTSAMARLINPGKRLPNKAGEPDFNDISRKYPLPEPLPSDRSNQHEAEEVNGNERFTSSNFTPPTAPQSHPHSPHGWQNPHGYYSHVSPFAQHPHAHHPQDHILHQQQPHYSEPWHHSEPLRYDSQHPPHPYNQPSPFFDSPSRFGSYHSPPAPFPHYGLPPARISYHHHPPGPPGMPPHRWHPESSPPGAPGMPPHRWHPELSPTGPQGIHHHRLYSESTPRNDNSRSEDDSTNQQHQRPSPETMAPILHTNQRGLSAHHHHANEGIEHQRMDERKQTTRNIVSMPDQNHALTAHDVHPLNGCSPSHFLKEPKPHSFATKALNYEEDLFNGSMAGIAYKTPEAELGYNSMNIAYKSPAAEPRHGTGELMYPLATDNYYEKEWVDGPPQKKTKKE